MAETEAGAARGRGGVPLFASLFAGLVGGLIAPLVYPVLARNARPAAKRAMKLGLTVFESGRVAAAELGERTSDLLAEARAEYEAELTASAGAENPAAASEVVPLRGSREAAAQ